jgi:hypothetical protein
MTGESPPGGRGEGRPHVGGGAPCQKRKKKKKGGGAGACQGKVQIAGRVGTGEDTSEALEEGACMVGDMWASRRTAEGGDGGGGGQSGTFAVIAAKRLF